VNHAFDQLQALLGRKVFFHIASLRRIRAS
jgi:hypothetical protein